jgi:hypothetical protein
VGYDPGRVLAPATRPLLSPDPAQTAIFPDRELGPAGDLGDLGGRVEILDRLLLGDQVEQPLDFLVEAVEPGDNLGQYGSVDLVLSVIFEVSVGRAARIQMASRPLVTSQRSG